MTGNKNLSIKGVSVNLATTLFGSGKTGTVINDGAGSISNGHWVILSGSSDLAIVRKALLTRVSLTELPWKESWSMQPDNPKARWSNKHIIAKTVRDLYYGKRYALAEDVVILRGDGEMCYLVGFTPVMWVGDNLYCPARTEMDNPYEVAIDPRYYFPFRKLGFDFLVGPGSFKPKVDSKTGEAEIDEETGNKVMVHEPQVVLLVRWVVTQELKVHGCLMPMKE